MKYGARIFQGFAKFPNVGNQNKNCVPIFGICFEVAT